MAKLNQIMACAMVRTRIKIRIMPMRKSATEHSKRGLKRHLKNVARKKRSEDLKKFND